jgi:hypothetical protein
MKRTRGIQWLLLAIVAALVLGCTSRATVQTMPMEAPAVDYVESEKAMVRGEAAYDAAAGVPLPGENDGAIVVGEGIERKIIYNVSLHLIVKDSDEAFAEVQRLTQELGGFVSESNMWRDGEYRRGSVTVRIPVGELDNAMEQFRALALDVESESVDSQDVTEEYVDLEARLENERRTEEELQELLETRSEIGKTEDILEVHRELSNVRAEIERIQGRMRYLDNLSALATVRITLTPDELMQPIDVGGWRPQGTARDAIRLLLRTLQFFADAAIVFVLFILPVLVVIAIPIAVVVLVIRGLVRRAKRRKREKAAE